MILEDYAPTGRSERIQIQGKLLAKEVMTNQNQFPYHKFLRLEEDRENLEGLIIKEKN